MGPEVWGGDQLPAVRHGPAEAPDELGHHGPDGPLPPRGHHGLETCGGPPAVPGGRGQG